MAKGKAKGIKGVQNRHLLSRISFLQQAAAHITLQRPASAPPIESTAVASSKNPVQQDAQQEQLDKSRNEPEIVREGPSNKQPISGGLALHLSSHVGQIARKSQIRLHPSVKHGHCKTCNSVLMDGQTVRKYIENLSRDGNKPHADVLVVECLACSTVKRFPIGAKRQRRKGQRGEEDRGKAATVGEGETKDAARKS